MGGWPKMRIVLFGCFHVFLQPDVLIDQVVAGVWERVHK